MNVDVAAITVSRTESVRAAMAAIDRGRIGLCLVADEGGRLVATVTDGDVRRALLADADLDAPATALVEQRAKEDHPSPLTAPVGTPFEELLALMKTYDLRHVPLVDDDGRAADVVVLADLVPDYRLPLRAVVMAGGYGSRLHPLTEDTPKPMLPVGDKPLLERIIGQLRDAGIRHVNLTTHYRADVIRDHFGNGDDFGVDIHYTEEDRPLGTAGALSLLEDAHEPVLVMNGDIVTRVDFDAMLRFHQEHRAEMTIAVRAYELKVPYGVVEVSGERVREIAEKPLVRGFVNAGIYLLDPEVCRLVPRDERYDMTDLIRRMLDAGRNVVGFPISEYWLDIGDATSYATALQDVEGE